MTIANSLSLNDVEVHDMEDLTATQWKLFKKGVGMQQFRYKTDLGLVFFSHQLYKV